MSKGVDVITCKLLVLLPKYPLNNANCFLFSSDISDSTAPGTIRPIARDQFVHNPGLIYL